MALISIPAKTFTCSIATCIAATMRRSSRPAPRPAAISSPAIATRRPRTRSSSHGIVRGFENIHISNCQITNTGMAGIAPYEVDGGKLQHVTIGDVTMDGVAVPISIRLVARLKTFPNGEKPRPLGASRCDYPERGRKERGIDRDADQRYPGDPVERG